MSINPLNDISKVYLEQVAAQQIDEVSADLALKASKEAGKRAGVLAGLSGGDPKVAAKARKKRVQAERLYSKQAKKRVVNVTPIKEEESEFEIEEGMTLQDYKKKRSALKQKEKRAADKISPGRRAGIHADKASPERAARHRANVDPDYDRDDEGDMYPGGKLKNPKKIRKAKALGELGEASHLETDMKKRQDANEKAIADMKKTKAHKDMVATVRKKFDEALDPKGAARQDATKEKKKIDVFAYDRKIGRKDIPPAPKNEALDPVGHEDADVDNDGKKNTNADKYLLKRRKAIGKAISTHEEKEVKRWWDDDGDGKGYEEGEVSGKFKKKKKIKEGFSNWREDLIEVMDVIGKEENEGKIEEKKVKNKIKINPSMGEAVENLGGTLLEMVEIDEVDYIVESVYDELLEEGYEEDDIEEAIEYALTEAKVTFGHDTSTGSTEKKKEGLLSVARKKLSGLKKSAKQAVATGARKVAKGALGVARKMEGGDKTPSAAHTGTRKASTYRGAGVGQKEKVSSGSYKGPEKKTTEKPADPWEGSATTPAKPKAKTKKAPAAKAKTTKVSGGTAKAPAKRKRASKLDDLLASVRSEEVQIDEKVLTAAETKKKEELVKSMKKSASDFESRYPGRGKEVMYATATKIAKKVAEQALEMQPKTSETSEKPDQQKKKTQQQQDRMRQQEVQILQRKLQALRSAPKGTDPSITAGYEPEGDVIDERRREEKGTPRKPRDPAFEFVAKKMGSSRMGVQPRGEKKEKGKKPPTAGEYGGPTSPAQKVAKRRAAAQRSQDMMHSRFD
jgi:hypothetical protein